MVGGIERQLMSSKTKILSASPTWRYVKWTIFAKITFACLLLAVLGLFSSNPLLTFCGFLLLPFLSKLTWYVGEPPVLFYVAGYQWMQVFVPVLAANVVGEELGASISLPEQQIATWLGFVAILILATGMSLGRGQRDVSRTVMMREQVYRLSRKNVLVAYVVTLFTPAVVSQFASGLPSIQQLLIPINLLHLVIVFISLYASVLRKDFRIVVVLMLALEAVTGFGGFSSAFKACFIMGIVIYATVYVQRESLLNPKVIVLSLLMLVMMLFWQSIKPEYRSFLNMGTKTQSVLVSRADRFDFVVEAASKVELEAFLKGWESGVRRLGYTTYFGGVIRQVPSSIPHQEGRLWGEAIGNILQPRLFFPGKAVLDDSARTNKYSGFRVSGVAEGSSIGLGYVAESYIDFGPILMFLPVFLIGLLWGNLIRLSLRYMVNSLVGSAVASVVILQVGTLFETSNAKMLGGTISSILVLSLLMALFGQGMWKILCGERLTR
jgi:hypothetical protein